MSVPVRGGQAGVLLPRSFPRWNREFLTCRPRRCQDEEKIKIISPRKTRNTRKNTKKIKIEIKLLAIRFRRVFFFCFVLFLFFLFSVCSVFSVVIILLLPLGKGYFPLAVVRRLVYTPSRAAFAGPLLFAGWDDRARTPLLSVRLLSGPARFVRL
jgi:hypothetical protein